MAEELLRIEHLHKRFGITHANRDISLTLDKGEIRALAGENGSGKSTLTSIISGMQQPTEGTMYLSGAPYKPADPLEANKAQVSMVVQELGVITTLTGAMNIFLGKTDRFKRMGLVDTKAMERAAEEIFETWNLVRVPLNIPCAHLTMEQRKIIELARALYIQPELLILDEITQSLSQDTRQVIYRLKERFKKEGRSIILISHDLEEAFEFSDSVTVLRDGEVVKTVSTEELTVDELKQMMVGRKIDGDYLRTDHRMDFEEEVLLEVKDMGLSDGRLNDISFELHKGEILGVCGLSDAGIHILGSALFGISDAKRTGTVLDKKTGKELKTPQDVLRSGGAYLSKNRDEEGLMMADTIRNNMYLPSAGELAGFMGMTREKDINALAQKAYAAFDVKAEGIGQPIGKLSGGNKQKINLGRWLVKDLNYIILDCPTRGVDIGVKAYIYQVLKQKKAEGVGCLLITDELTEALGMADRILIMKNGRLSGILERGEDFSESKIIEVML